MTFRNLLILLFLLIGVTAHADEMVKIRGSLQWSNERQTLTDCVTGQVYWVRVLASNPNYLLSKKVEELELVSKNIIAEFKGEVTTGSISNGPKYHVDGTLNVSQIISMENGVCK
jgi:hypothetical protein